MELSFANMSETEQIVDAVCYCLECHRDRLIEILQGVLSEFSGGGWLSLTQIVCSLSHSTLIRMAEEKSSLIANGMIFRGACVAIFILLREEICRKFNVPEQDFDEWRLVGTENDFWKTFRIIFQEMFPDE
jgi:hypothetical protein